MHGQSPPLRATLLLSLVVVTSWLPSAAAEWLLDSNVGRAPRLAHPSPRPAPERLSEEPLSLPVAPPVRKVDAEPPRLDLRGNEIVRPVAHYGVDGRGGLYELHSPQTEVLRLAPPDI